MFPYDFEVIGLMQMARFQTKMSTFPELFLNYQGGSIIILGNLLKQKVLS